MKKALRQLLITALSSLVGTRVTWAERPQSSALPAVVLNRISEEVRYVYSGPVKLESARIQVDIYSLTPDQAEDVYQLLKEEVSGFVGVFGGIDFTILLENRAFDSVEEASGTTTSLHRISRDLRVNYKETENV